MVGGGGGGGGGGGVYIHIFRCSARLISFEMNLISKEIRRAEHEYMNIHPQLNAVVTPLTVKRRFRVLRYCIHRTDKKIMRLYSYMYLK